MFAKMMDSLAEELSETDHGFKITDDLIIAVLLWVDDVISIAEGNSSQNYILEAINQFALNHKIKWGKDKCKVMPIGKNREEKQEWKVGDMIIDETEEYKYLGDIISYNGKKHQKH